jgi:acetoin utilization deacetylase AcuC-like enzyme
MWPGTGHPSEPTAPNVVNAVSPMGASREVWRKAFESLMPKVDAFAPDLIIVSAGFDAHVATPSATAASPGGRGFRLGHAGDRLRG